MEMAKDDERPIAEPSRVCCVLVLDGQRYDHHHQDNLDLLLVLLLLAKPRRLRFFKVKCPSLFAATPDGCGPGDWNNLKREYDNSYY